MSTNNYEGTNVLTFKRVVKRSAPAVDAASELKDILIVYDRLISLLRETCDEGLDNLADNIVETVVRCRKALADGVDGNATQTLVKEMREGLRQIPGNLRALLPGIGPRLCESMERKLGIQFSSS